MIRDFERKRLCSQTLTSVTCGGTPAWMDARSHSVLPPDTGTAYTSAAASAAGNANMTTNGMVTRARKKESMMKDQQELIEQVVGCHAFMSLSLDGLATSFHGTETLSPYTVRALDAAIFPFAMESYPRGFQFVDTSARHVAETILEERRVELGEPKLPWNALQLAAYHGSVGFTKTLLEHGADHNFSIPTPLSIAAFSGHVGAADALLAKGAGVNLVRQGPCPHVEFGDGLERSPLPILAA